MPSARRTLWIDSPAQLRALTSPVRQEIVDLLSAGGPASIAAIAAHLGRPADGLYFHIRRLLRAGLLVEHTPASGGRRAARYDVPGRPLRIRSAGPAAPVERVLNAAMRLGMRDLGRALRLPGVRLGGAKPDLRAGRHKGWLGAAELRRVHRLLQELLQTLQAGRPGRGRRLHTFTFVLTPAPPNRRAPRAPAGDPP